MRTYIKVPIKIITPKIAKNKQNSIFYAGHNIAEVKVRDRTYVLTTAGEYKFSMKENSDPISFTSDRMIGAGAPGRTRYNILSKLTDNKIAQTVLIENWGWFGINVWDKIPTLEQPQPGHFQIVEKETCLDTPVEVWSEYDEALAAFIEYVEKDLASKG